MPLVNGKQVQLTEDWSPGSHKITVSQFESTVASGTPPLVVASNTRVPNLNADLLDGVEASSFLQNINSEAITDLSDVTAKSGTGTIVIFQGSPTLTTPTIASFVNAAHDHQDAAGGAQLDHGLALTGLDDDDHTGYFLADGTRTLTHATRPTITYNNAGLSNPVASGSTAAGDKLVFWENPTLYKAAIGVGSAGELWLESSRAAALISFWTGITGDPIKRLTIADTYIISTVPILGTTLGSQATSFTTAHIDQLYNTNNASMIQRVGSNTVLNEDRRNMDVIVYGDITTSLLYCQANPEKVGIGTASPKTKLTVQGTITLSEQAAADTDTAAYGQIWVKTATPCQLWFTDDAGGDIQLGVGGGVTDHGALTGLSDDDHPGYLWGVGRASSQTLIGGTAASETLTLQSTSHTTRGQILLPDNMLLGSGSVKAILEAQRIASNHVILNLSPDSGNSVVSLYTHPIGTQDQTRIGVTNNPSTTNFGWLRLRLDATLAYFESGKEGTGSAPTIFFFNVPRVIIKATASNKVPLDVTGAAGQTSHLQDWKADGGTILSNVNNLGYLALGQVGQATTVLTITGTMSIREQAAADAGVAGLGRIWVKDDTPNTLYFSDDGGTDRQILDHGAQAGLSDDDHSIYALLAGRSGNQTLTGGTAGAGTLTLQSTSHSTKGKIWFGANSVYDEQNIRLGIGRTSPLTTLHVETSGNAILRFDSIAGIPAIELLADTDIKLPQIVMIDRDTSTQHGRILIDRNSGRIISGAVQNDFIIDVPSTQKLHLATQAVARLTVDNAGLVGIGTVTPKTKLTVEGALTLKEQAAADGDTASYGQFWVKDDAPNIPMFTDDAGNDYYVDLTPV